MVSDLWHFKFLVCKELQRMTNDYMYSFIVFCSHSKSDWIYKHDTKWMKV